MVINVSIAKKEMGSYIQRNKLWLSLCECISLSLIVNIDDSKLNHNCFHFVTDFLILNSLYCIKYLYLIGLKICYDVELKYIYDAIGNNQNI